MFLYLNSLESEVVNLLIIWIVGTIAVTLTVVKLYRFTPFYDPGFAIWTTPDQRSMSVTKLVFRRYGSRPTFDFSDEAVLRQAFANGIDVVNCTLDPVMKTRLAGVHAARAFATHNPHRVTRQVVDALRKEGQPAVAWFNPDSHVKKGYMAFITVEGQGWMYVFRRHKFLMMIDQKRGK